MRLLFSFRFIGFSGQHCHYFMRVHSEHTTYFIEFIVDGLPKAIKMRVSIHQIREKDERAELPIH